jgi:hypothetical protein
MIRRSYEPVCRMDMWKLEIPGGAGMSDLHSDLTRLFDEGYHSRDEEVAALKAEIERKDEALHKISDHIDVRLEIYKNNREALYGVQSIAREALKGEEEE